MEYFSKCSFPTVFDRIRQEEKDFFQNEAKYRLHFGLLPKRSFPKFRLPTGFESARDDGKGFSRMRARIFDHLTWKRSAKDLRVSKASNNLSRIQLVEGRNLNPGHQQPAKYLICYESQFPMPGSKVCIPH
jgi:hypothetical protein